MKNLCQSSFGGKPRIKVLADADMVLELFINRKGFVEDSERLLMEIAQSQQVEVYVTDKCLKRIRIEDKLGDEASLFVEKMLHGRVIKIDSDIRALARVNCLLDYDSAEEVACAKSKRLNVIVTQNPNNFDGTDLLVLSLESLLTRLQLEQSLDMTNILKALKECLFKSGNITELDILTNEAEIPVVPELKPNTRRDDNTFLRSFPQLNQREFLSVTLSFYRLRLQQFGLLGSYEPDEVINEAIYRLHHALENGEKINSIQPWLRATGFNIIREYSREQKKYRSLNVFSKNLELITLPEQPDSVYVHLYQALHELSEENKNLLILRFFKQLSYVEMVQHLAIKGVQVSDATILQRVLQALMALRKAFFEKLKWK